ncbi:MULTISPECIES: Hpt domain-containing protein [unclassified Sphingomonas]|uniref:Hpt domain-containing protein n=1 Tax=unclassified Sphingomonas TaxID=196159 RepID=UPI001D10842F|nr:MULTISPECIES: Hpt domain-containing protein [unclassified Sphingomonas]MCC2979944.1 Hpt domain-containing protein [Sphingomonas sp. IC4-52]MCD2314706.1 Hpt domain-containing protein [Sphingomonas sp. IC-11]
MAIDPGAIDAALAAAVGDDPALIAELRAAFVDSAHRGLAAIENAADEESWRAAAWRLKGLAASFGAVRLVALATEATRRPVGDRAMIKRLRQAIARL